MLACKIWGTQKVVAIVGGGQVVSMVAFNSDDTSSNTAEVYNLIMQFI